MKQCKETKMMIWTHCFKHFNPWSLSRLFIGQGEAYSGTYMIQECCLFLDGRKLEKKTRINQRQDTSFKDLLLPQGSTSYNPLSY